MKTYSALFIFPVSLNDEALKKAIEQVEMEITKLNGIVRYCNIIGKRTFARPMKKREAGHYVKIGLTIGREKISAVLARFKLNENIFRVQITQEKEEKKDDSGNKAEEVVDNA